VNGFDHNFVFWGFEDQEFAYRLFKLGFEIYLNKNVIGYHQWHEKEFLDINRRFEMIKTHGNLLFKKYLSKDTLYIYSRYVFMDVNEQNVEILYDQLIVDLFYNYKNFYFSKSDFDYFLKFYYEWKQNKDKFKENNKINKLCTDVNYLVKVLNNGGIKTFL
jgi:hypothetical protein